MYGKIVVSVLIAAALVCGFAGCAKEQTEPPADSGMVSDSGDETGFDIERVRKNIVIKGQTIEIPVKLGDIPEGWSYELFDEEDVYLRENQFLATMYYNGEEMYIAALENYYPDKPEESIIYNFTIYDNDCSIDGLIPSETTKEDVVKRYGEPISKSVYNGCDYYCYGIVNGENKVGGRLNDHSIGIRFDENDAITAISITYADLTKEY